MILKGPWGGGDDDEGQEPELVDESELPPVDERPRGPAGGYVQPQPQLEQLWGRLDAAMRYARMATSRVAAMAPPESDGTIKELLETYNVIQGNVAQLSSRLKNSGSNTGPGPSMVDVDADLQQVEKQVQSYVDASETLIARTVGPQNANVPQSRSTVLAQGGTMKFNPLWIALGVGAALTGVAIWQARKTDSSLRGAPPVKKIKRKRH